VINIITDKHAMYQLIEPPHSVLFNKKCLPIFYCGDALDVLKQLPSESVDCIVTSPPYWNKRQYESGGIGLEMHPNEFIDNLLLVTNELHRVLKNTGSFWLNIGDTYKEKALQAIPWRLAIRMIDDQNWLLRNSVIWNKQKGAMDSAKDRFRNVHENFFHFTKSKYYYFDDESIRSNPRKSIIKNGALISATGVSGIRYKRQIELSTSLNAEERKAALTELNSILSKVQKGEINDFRMIIRGQQRATHSNESSVSGRAKELASKGFYFLIYNSQGTLPTDVWDIIPEDTQQRVNHYAPFPEDLCKIPILCTCPIDGVVLDPFCGTGTANSVAFNLERKSIGIDISSSYIQLAVSRLAKP
jgi:site-specific DNA-methyltransferase (adenine-specific)